MDLRLTPVDREATPLGELTLTRYDAPDGTVGHQVAIDGHFLMATHGCGSERALAPIAHAAWLAQTGASHRFPETGDSDPISAASPRGLNVLVGGLGAGHTLRAALDLPGVARVVVAEIGAKVFQWNRLYFAEANGHAVDDPRVVPFVGDLHDILERTDHDDPSGAPGKRGRCHPFRETGRRHHFDLMLLDVDNGPGRLAAEGNARLYDAEGLRRCRDALAPGGVLAVWSPCHDPAFLEGLRAVFPDAREVDTRPWSSAVGEIPDVVYVAPRPRD